jgi:Ca-activated chloride channel family protein
MYVRRTLALLVLGAALAGRSEAQTAGLRLAQPNAARFPEVSLYAYPTDPRGAVLSGLDAAAFEVRENGLPAAITSVQAAGVPLEVCLALDRSPSMQNDGKLEFARAAAAVFVNQLAAEDRAALVTFSSGSSLAQGLTGDRRALLAAIERAEAGGDSTTFLDAVYWSITQVAVHSAVPGSIVGSGPARPDARRVVLALTDGQDRSSRVLTEELIDLARQNGVSLFMVALGGDAETSRMQYLARQTGGQFLAAPRPADLAQLYARIAADLRREYRVTFRSPRPETDGSRRTVLMALPGHGSEATTWYTAPTQGSLLGSAQPALPAGAAVGGGAGTGRPGPPALLWPALGLTAAGAGVLALVAWRSRRRVSRLVDSNPRLDLLPLWVREGSTRVGRGNECELVLDSHEVSRLHARIEAWDGVYRIVDEASRNGTYINGRRVRRRAEIRVGDRIRFGDREFRFAGRQRQPT